MRNIITLTIIFACSYFGIERTGAEELHGWPLEPINAEHPIGNSFGEFQGYSFGMCQHSGIDILGNPKFDWEGIEDIYAPWACVTVDGMISDITIDESYPCYNGVTIKGSDGVEYKYWHLEKNSFDVDFMKNWGDGNPISAKDKIAKIVRWFEDDFHHLHYELIKNISFVNPLADIVPDLDSSPPKISDIYFANNDITRWSVFGPESPGGSTVVKGNTDIIFECHDKNDEESDLIGAATLWVYNVRWRVYHETNPFVLWQETYKYDGMPITWNTIGNVSTTALFSRTDPWKSSSDYGSETELYGIVTNFSGGVPESTGFWDTAAVSNGSYTVSIEAEDFAGNTCTHNERVLVQNGTGFITELTIRDALDDQGAIPYMGDVWWLSPDITANPGEDDEDVNIRLGLDNVIEVQVWNFGGADLSPGTTYDISLGWDLPTCTLPLPLNQVIGTKKEIIGGTDDWKVGTSRMTTFEWKPDPSEIPSGHHCLLAWVDMSEDPAMDTPSVKYDDNRAQQNISFIPIEPPGAPVYCFFNINPQPGITKRSLEMTFKYSGSTPTLKKVFLHVRPGLKVEQIIGGYYKGAYQGEKLMNERAYDAMERTQEPPVRFHEAQKAEYTWIISGIDPQGRLRLEDFTANETVQLAVEVQPETAIESGQFVNVNIIEYGILAGSNSVESVGGLTIRFAY